jgi:Mg2+-importing ATPase
MMNQGTDSTKTTATRPKKPNGIAARVSQPLQDAARKEAPEVLAQLQSSENGLAQEAAEQRLEEVGPNQIAAEKHRGPLIHLLHALRNPLVVLLVILACIAFATRNDPAGTVMSLMVVLGVSLRFVQEFRADKAAAKLKAMIHVTATVFRDGAEKEIPLHNIVPGDVVKLAAGDMIPADVRLLSAKDLFLTQGSLTGESFPVEKFAAVETRPVVRPLELSNICFMGTSVASGTAKAAVVLTGQQTYLGAMSRSILRQPPPTSFDKGISKFTWLMIRLIMILTPLVFLINGLSKHDWEKAFFFALAVAVGLAPEMLPMIVTVCLSKGAIAMGRKKVIVKRLNSIQNFGGIDVLCTDKTGTLTIDRVILERHCDVVRQEDDGVMMLAFLNSHFQTGLKNVLDRSILEHVELHQEIPVSAYRKLDEIPFDFSRKMMSVVVETPEARPRMILKGAPDEVFKRCTQFVLDGELYPMEPILVEDLREEFQELSSEGFRVLAIAYKDLERKEAYSKEDEAGLILRGYVAFLDPPKETARPAIAALNRHGVAVKILTGDNELVSRKICSDVGIPTEQMLLGAQIEQMTDADLAEAAEKTTLFARLSPTDKERIVRAIQSKNHVVGFLGDGINDSPGLRAADVGISVDTAVDIAKESADIILLEKNLMILEEGVLEGRKVFANILKYIRMGASSNFGNMFSVLGASAFLPFLPMMPLQVLTNNLLYDLSQVPIPTDEVDPEQLAKPMPWAMDRITRFITLIGPLSSLFDYTTYFVMLYVFACYLPGKESLFQTGWFVESLLTQTLIIHIIRTNKIPFIQSRASWPLIITTALIMATGIWLPFSPFAPALGFTADIPALYWPILIATLLLYALLTNAVKMYLFRRGKI